MYKGKCGRKIKIKIKHSAQIKYRKRMNWDDVFQYIDITLFISIGQLIKYGFK